MTRSIFDPTGNETEHSGSQILGPQAGKISQMPPGPTEGANDCEGGNDKINMGPVDGAQVSRARSNRAGLPEEDAPQESDVIDDPRALMEGQPSDDSDAPQESAQ